MNDGGSPNARADLRSFAHAPAPPADTGTRGAREALVVCDNLVRIFNVADLEAIALQGLDLVVEPGEIMAVVGASGSGKSTLLNILGGLDVPTAGRAVVGGLELGRLSRRARTDYRRRVVGMVWQQTARNLLPYVTAAQNVELPMVLDGRAHRRRRAAELLDLVGLGERGGHRPDRLSGGEQQRVAIAVALANAPQLLLADEPTGELDSATATEIFDVLHRVNVELGTTVMVVTHDPLVTTNVPRTVAIRDGRTSSEILRHTTTSADGTAQVVVEEFALLDHGGRLQLPREHIQALAMADRVRVRLEDDHVGIWPEVPGPSRPERYAPRGRTGEDAGAAR
jgi:ABC-type lipoprotein export system ATPase subunit